MTKEMSSSDIQDLWQKVAPTFELCMKQWQEIAAVLEPYMESVKGADEEVQPELTWRRTTFRRGPVNIEEFRNE